jgi:TRAP-type transport system periplasmic protein
VITRKVGTVRFSDERQFKRISRGEFVKLASTFGFMAALGSVATACGEDVGERASQESARQNEKAAQAEQTLVLSVDGIPDRWPDQPVYNPTMYHFGTWELKEAIERQSDDRIFVDIQTGGSLGVGADLVQKLQQGIVDIGNSSTQNAAAAASVWNVTDFPYTIGGVENYWKIVYSKEVNDTLRRTSEEEFNLVALTIFPQLRWLQLRPGLEEIRAPDGVSGLKIRVTGSRLEQESFDILPTNPTPIDWTETRTALEEGTIDGCHVAMASIADASIHEAVGQAVDTQWMYNADTNFMGKPSFDRLPEDLQEAVLEGAFEAQAWIQDNFERLHREQVGIREDSPPDSIYQQEDVELVYLTDEERAEWEQTLGYENNQARYDEMIDQYGREEYEAVVNVANSEGAAEQKPWWK